MFLQLGDYRRVISIIKMIHSIGYHYSVICLDIAYPYIKLHIQLHIQLRIELHIELQPCHYHVRT